MTTFRELLQVGRCPTLREDQEFASRELPGAVAGSTLHWWKPGDEVPSKGRRLLIGVAPYSAYDLTFLDLLDRSLRRAPDRRVRVDVFDTLECKTMGDFDAFIPGIGQVFQTPVVGLWEEGQLRERAWGKAGRDLAGNVLRIPEQEIAKQISAAIPRFDLSFEGLAHRLREAIRRSSSDRPGTRTRG